MRDFNEEIELMNPQNTIPIIPPGKNYWLVRTQGGRYYSDFRKGGFIAINWDLITTDDIRNMTPEELSLKVRQEYPKITSTKSANRTANQLRIFNHVIKKGDTIIITGVSSNRLSIGEVLESETYTEYIDQDKYEKNNKICPFLKRKKVRWIKELRKYELDMELFKLLQHSQHTISEANNYGDLIEGLIHNFFIRGDQAQIQLQVKKKGNIPAIDFFPMGAEILQLAKEFNDYSKVYNIDLNSVATKVNVNSPGKVNFTGKVKSITIIGLIIVTLTGGGGTLFPKLAGGLELKMNSVVREVSEFLNQKQQRDHQDLILKTYMKDLEIKTPEELVTLLRYFEDPSEKTIPAIAEIEEKIFPESGEGASKNR